MGMLFDGLTGLSAKSCSTARRASMRGCRAESCRCGSSSMSAVTPLLVLAPVLPPPLPPQLCRDQAVHVKHKACSVKNDLKACSVKKNHKACSVKKNHKACSVKKNHKACSVKNDLKACSVK